jgi:hypothetical protein
MHKLAIIKTVQAGINDAGTVGHGNAGEIKGYQLAEVQFVGHHYLILTIYNDTDCPYGYATIDEAREHLIQMITDPPPWVEDTTVLNFMLEMTTSGNNYTETGVADSARASLSNGYQSIWK